jgi:hypothetical protein
MFFIVKNHWEPYFTDNLRTYTIHDDMWLHAYKLFQSGQVFILAREGIYTYFRILCTLIWPSEIHIISQSSKICFKTMYIKWGHAVA